MNAVVQTIDVAGPSVPIITASVQKKPRQPNKKTRAMLAAARAEGYEAARDELGGGRMLACLVWGLGLAVPAFLLGLWIG